MNWSTHFQTPDYLERTRLMLIAPEMEPLIGTWCAVREGSCALDVGCGTGFFTRLLKRAVPGAQRTGLDVEERFILRAREEAEKERLAIDFLTGDAGALPFEDNAFDVVVSHTFLTSAENPEKVFAEMKRVVRPGRRIASVTPMPLRAQGAFAGDYPPEDGWSKELMTLAEELWGRFPNLELASFMTKKQIATPGNWLAAGLPYPAEYGKIDNGRSSGWRLAGARKAIPA